MHVLRPCTSIIYHICIRILSLILAFLIHQLQVTCQLEPLEGLEAASLPRLIHIQVVTKICSKYAQDMPKYVQFIPKICSRYAKICPIYAQHVRYTCWTLLIHIQVVAGEAGEYDVVYSLPKEGRWTQMAMMMVMMMMVARPCCLLSSKGGKVDTDGDEIDDDDGVYFLPKELRCLLTNKINKVTVNFSDTRCGSEFMAVTSKIVLSRWAMADTLPTNEHWFVNYLIRKNKNIWWSGDLFARRGGAEGGEVVLWFVAKTEDFGGETGEGWCSWSPNSTVLHLDIYLLSWWWGALWAWGTLFKWL